MPRVRIDPALEMHYELDDYTDPWRTAETVLMLHGNAECAAAWFGWVPTLARHFRLVRPDLRGFGGSTPMPCGFPWSLDLLVEDCARLLDALGTERCHLIGAKLGATLARRLAACHPQRILTLTLVGAPGPRYQDRAQVAARVAGLEREGVEPWARRTMAGRLGSHFPPEGVEWWIQMMARTPVATIAGFLSAVAAADVSADLARIRCPTLVITTEASGLGSVEQTQAWVARIPDARLLVLPGDSYHVAASDPERCAQATLAFILERRAAAAAAGAPR
ncbi:MAG TPA: alpha/beta hydrolase [Burkholderiales bacterium]|nr:alpha/beta hydrolase [Burkholderiales bacterium]